MSLDLHRLYSPSQPRPGVPPGLTELQQETLVAALEVGYYELPREVTMGALAEEPIRFNLQPTAYQFETHTDMCDS
jgi:predicted DNA binding protein